MRTTTASVDLHRIEENVETCPPVVGKQTGDEDISEQHEKESVHDSPIVAEGKSEVIVKEPLDSGATQPGVGRTTSTPMQGEGMFAKLQSLGLDDSVSTVADVNPDTTTKSVDDNDDTDSLGGRSATHSVAVPDLDDTDLEDINISRQPDEPQVEVTAEEEAVILAYPSPYHVIPPGDVPPGQLLDDKAESPTKDWDKLKVKKKKSKSDHSRRKKE